MLKSHSTLFGVCLASFVAAGVGTPFARAQIEVAGELLVDLDAADATAGEAVWANKGTMDDFERVGNPMVEDVAGAAAVTFNTGFDLDAYQSVEPAPDGLVGPDPTRSIEVWAYNPEVADEETLVAWGYRGGPDGSNMSFNYGANENFGAVGHWGAGPDIGWSGGAPAAGQWHHLVYTYDGADTFTTRVYADGCLIGDFCNFEVLAAGTINTHAGSPIVLAAQIDNDAGQLNAALLGTLSLARVRIHDDVLSEEQVLANFEAEQSTYIQDSAPEFVSVPGEGSFAEDNERYQTRVVVSGFPEPVIEAVAPPGATATDGLYSYAIPDPAPASFVATVRATNRAGTVEASWTVTRQAAPEGGIQVAEDLLVSLDAAHDSAGDFVWENQGSAGNFEIIGEPLSEKVLGVPAVTFNSGPDLDAYRSTGLAPLGLVGVNPTRSIEVWVYNPSVANEETMVAWGYRGGPDGTNMSFNYGTNDDFGAVGHWGDPDIGWNDGGGAPAPGVWHHLVYTYDGAETFTTRVYADGCLSAELCNAETLEAGAINTFEVAPILVAVQVRNATGELDISGRVGTLSIGRVRIHDGVLSGEQVLANYELEKDDFSPVAPPEFDLVPDDGSYFVGTTTYTALVSAVGTPPITIEAVAPPGATVVDGVYSYDIPDPEPASFVATVKASNEGGSVEASWTVSRRDLPPAGEIAVAEALIVSLDADDGTGGEDVWENQVEASPVGDFVLVGEPFFEWIDAELEGIADQVPIGAITFNTGNTQDAYQSEENAAGGLVGLDATRSIEVWAHNPDILPEETLISWGRRGGPDGSNIAFNYGNHASFGAVGQWGAGPDLGWDNGGGAPEAGVWHHLVYTYDGATTRVYADGELRNSEELGPGVINTHAAHPITIAAQIQDAAGALNFEGLQGVLSIARIRVHDGVLFPEEILHNYNTDIADFAGIEPGGARLQTGDVNGDATYNISDPVAHLSYLFAGGELPDCFVVEVTLTEAGLAILDFNGDGASNIADAVGSLNFLFGGGVPPALGEGCAEVMGDCETSCL